jgi:phage repressor protein C with HTH and peptisase S24 domain
MVDPEVKAIAEALRVQGRSHADLGRVLGLDSSQMTRLFKGQRRLQRHEWKTAAAYLRLSDPGDQAAGGTIVPLPGMIPLYGWTGASSQERLTFADQTLRGYVPSHPNQAHVRAAFALEVADVSMSPRYEPGEVIYVAPNRWPTRGQDCVVVTVDGGGYLKRFLRRTETEVVVQQLNPEREIAFALDAVEAVHTVVGRS